MSIEEFVRERLSKVKFLGRWDYNVTVEDPSLRPYINLKPWFLPKTCGRYQKERFGKANIPILERIVGRLMTPGHFGKKHKFTSYRASGKWYKNMKTLIKALEIIEKRAKTNPLQVLIKAIENAAPREETTLIEHGGSRYPKAVEVSPQRRVDLAIRHIVWGAFHRSRNKKGSIEEALANEILKAYENSIESFAIQKKLEIEKVAAASR